MPIKAEGITDIGRIRQNNEDTFLIDSNIGLFIVSDGMGGHQAGEIASHLAVEVIRRCFASTSENSAERLPKNLETTLQTGSYKHQSATAKSLSESVKLANTIIHQAGESDIHYQGMGCTVAVLLMAEPGKALIANVGDSRVYLIRDGKIRQLTDDHTLLNEYLKTDPDFFESKNELYPSHLEHILVRALGSEPVVDVDLQEIETFNQDIFLLCSDGLTDMVSDEEILEIIESEKRLDKMCSKLIGLANEKGGVDNITVVLVKIFDEIP